MSKEKENIGEGYVVRDWIRELSWKQQTVLLSSIRGCDGAPKHDDHKAFVRPLRGIILKNAEPENEDDTFMNHPDEGEINEFAHDLDDYPMHWLVHFIHAVEIVGYKHPESSTREFWRNLYETICREAFHMTPESALRMERRLSP